MASPNFALMKSNSQLKNGEFAVVNSANLFRGAFEIYKMTRKNHHYKNFVLLWRYYN